MASISEMLISGVQGQTESAGKQTTEAINTAVEIGMKREQMAAQKQQLAAAKEKLELERYDSFAQSIEKGYKLQGQARTNYFKSYIPQRAALLGIGPDRFNPTVLNMLASDDESVMALIQARENVQNGTMTPSQVKSLFVDPEVWAEQSTQLIEDYKQSLDRKAKVESQQLAISSQERRQETQIQARREEAIRKEKAAPQLKLDTEFGKKVAIFEDAGGTETMDKNIKSLEAALNALKKPGKLTGTLGDKAVALIPFEGLRKAIQDIGMEETASVRDMIGSAIQGTLRPILGAQFAAIEGQMIFERAFNPALSEKENIRRIELELNSLKKRAAKQVAAVEYFKKNQTLEGFSGSLEGTTFDTMKLGNKDIPVTQLQQGYLNAKNKEKWIQDGAKAAGMKPEEFKKRIGAQ